MQVKLHDMYNMTQLDVTTAVYPTVDVGTSFHGV